MRLATTHAVSAVQALVASAVANGDMAATIANWGVTHHVFELSIECALLSSGAGLNGRPTGHEIRMLLCFGSIVALGRELFGARIFDDLGFFLDGLHLSEVVALQVLDPENAKEVVHDGSGELDVRVSTYGAVGLEAGEGELLDIGLEWYAVLQTHGDGHSKAVHQAAEGGALFVHVDEDFAELTVLVLTGT